MADAPASGERSPTPVFFRGFRSFNDRRLIVTVQVGRDGPEIETLWKVAGSVAVFRETSADGGGRGGDIFVAIAASKTVIESHPRLGFPAEVSLPEADLEYVLYPPFGSEALSDLSLPRASLHDVAVAVDDEGATAVATLLRALAASADEGETPARRVLADALAGETDDENPFFLLARGFERAGVPAGEAQAALAEAMAYLRSDAYDPDARR